MIQSPCKDCQERTPNCHAGCKKYQGYKKHRSNEIKSKNEKNTTFVREWRGKGDIKHGKSGTKTNGTE